MGNVEIRRKAAEPVGRQWEIADTLRYYHHKLPSKEEKNFVKLIEEKGEHVS